MKSTVIDPPQNNWRVINSGGSDRMAFVFGQWVYPRFATHDACRLWWRKYCQQNPDEQTPWAITEKL